MPTHPFLKADKSKLGYYKPINRTTNPEQFRDPTEQPAADAAALERLNRLVQGVPSRPSTRQSTQERSDETADEMPQEPENPKDSDYVPDGGVSIPSPTRCPIPCHCITPCPVHTNRAAEMDTFTPS